MSDDREYIFALTDTEAVTIANGASESAAIEVFGLRAVGIQMPAAWTAAALTFLASADGTNFYPLYDQDGNEVVVTVAAARFVQLFTAYFQGMTHVKLRSGVAALPVNQGADRILIMVLAPVR